MNCLIEEGVFEITMRDTRNFNGARCNLLTAMTPELFRKNKLMWSRMGFLSRLIPFSYKYSDEKIEIINKSIAKNNIEINKPIKLNLPLIYQDISLPENIALKIIPIAENIAKSEVFIYKTKDTNKHQTELEYCFRHQKQLNVLLKANAILNNRNTVNEEDYNEIEKLSIWMNYDYNYI
jgi:hypothetical protein